LLVEGFPVLSENHTRDRKDQQPTLAVDDGVDFRRATTASNTDRLILFSPLALMATRWVFTIVLSIKHSLSRDFDARGRKSVFRCRVETNG